MNLKEINSYWGKSVAKEASRHTNAPKPHKGDKFSVPEDFSNFAPPLTKFRKANEGKR